MEDYIFAMAVVAATFTAINKMNYGKLAMIMVTIVICVIVWKLSF